MVSQVLFVTCSNYVFYNTLQILWSQYIEHFHNFISILFPDTEDSGIFNFFFQSGGKVSFSSQS